MVDDDGELMLPDPDLIRMVGSEKGTREMRAYISAARDEMLEDWEQQQRARAATEAAAAAGPEAST